MKKILLMLVLFMQLIGASAQCYDASETKFNGDRYAGFGGTAEVGYVFGDYKSVAAVGSVGYRFNRVVYAGAGLGYNFNQEIGTFPVFGHLRLSVPSSKVAQPFADLKAGVCIEDGLSGASGVCGSVSAGVRLDFCTLAIGYSGQALVGGGIEGFTLRLGFVF